MPEIYRNPIYPRYFADPFVFRHDAIYYAVGTGAEGVFAMLRSPDLISWTPLGAAMTALHPDYGDSYWAPEIAVAGGRFWLYYSVGRGDKSHHLRVAVSERPEGPYEDAGVRLTNPFHCPFAIDASPFQDDDGQWYLFYARDFLDTDGAYRAGTGLAVDRLVDMTTLAGEERVVLRATHDWQRFRANRVMYGSCYDWHTLEGPCVRKHNESYYCLFSAGCWENETYGVDYAVASHVLGPYFTGDNSGGPRLLRTVPGKVIGPGHNCVISGPDGETDYIVYHAWDASMTARRMCLDVIEWTPDGPRSPGPTF